MREEDPTIAGLLFEPRIRWPGKIKAGSVSNEITHHMDWRPTFMVAAGVCFRKQVAMN